MNTKRIRKLNNLSYKSGDIVYWMSRDQRVEDNWALIYGQQLAKEHGVFLHVVFCLRESFPYATERLIDFMLKGLQEVEEKLTKSNISFSFLLGNPEEKIRELVQKNNIGFLIKDFSPLHTNSEWNTKVGKKLSIPFHEVDTHNIVPVWEASPKQEYGAYTIRPKIHRLLPEFLDEFPALHPQKIHTTLPHRPVDWKKVRHSIQYDSSVKAVEWILPGETHATHALANFIENRLPQYYAERNDPTKDAQSNLSPYIHFGHLSAQRIAQEIGKVKGHTQSKDAFLEELVVRKELSDNFCFYNSYYDSPKGFPQWATQTLHAHSADPKEYIYSRRQLEEAKTHDELWNAAQKEMVHRGKMHGYLRMYWAKKLLEWSPDVATAQSHSIYLNNTYFLDGRDPNGYTGIAWSLGGVHDRPWFERPIFGKIRYMNYNGAKSKFDTAAYIAKQ